MKHVRCSNPYLWDGLETRTVGSTQVAWLLLVPIGDAEAAYSDTYGPDALAALLEESEVDVADPDRAEVVGRRGRKGRTPAPGRTDRSS